MSQSTKELTDLLIDCTVRIEKGEFTGTGFFVAPGAILTCAHVVTTEEEKKRTKIEVIYKGKTYSPKKISTKDLFAAAYPDLALLRVNISKHPCVFLDGNYNVNDLCFSYGYTVSQQNGEATTLVCVGPWNQGAELIKLKAGDVQHGSSGSPLLNLKTGYVCGIVQASRNPDPAKDIGGYAFPIKNIGNHYPRLISANKKFHNRDLRWTNAIVGLPAQSTTVKAFFFTRRDDLKYLPENLVGRRADLKIVSKTLMKSRRLVISGMGGIGKTVIAAKLAESYLKKGNRVIWVEAGYSSLDYMIDSIAACCNKRASLAKQASDNRSLVLREILEESRVKLVVIDDMWNPDEVEKLIAGFPKIIPVLVTSQLRESLGWDILALNELDDVSALKLLSISSGKGEDYSTDLDARAICAQFGNHPYAIELAGKSIKEMEYGTPKALREMLSIDFVDLSPLGIEEFRNRLIKNNYSKLDSFTKKALRAFGAFSIFGITSQLICFYLGKPRKIIEKSLIKLSSRSLVKKRADSSYYLHSLIYGYIVSLPGLSRDVRNTTAVVLDYLRVNSQNFDLVGVDLPSILVALQNSRPNELIQGMCYLVLGGFPRKGPDSYFDARGHTMEMLDLLDRAIRVAEGKKKSYEKLLSSLCLQSAVAKFDRGQYHAAIQFFEKALKYTRDKHRKIIVGSAVARTMAFVDRYNESKPIFDRLYTSASKLKDPGVKTMVLDQLAWAAGYSKDYKTAKTASLEQVKLEKSRYDLSPEQDLYEDLFYSYLKLGSATLDLAIQNGDDASDALDIHMGAWGLVENKDNPRLKGLAKMALGEDYGYLKKKQKSINAFQEAYGLLGSVGMTEKQNELVDLVKSFGYFSYIKRLIGERRSPK